MLSTYFKKHKVFLFLCLIGIIYIGFVLINQEMKFNELNDNATKYQEEILQLKDEVEMAQQELDNISSIDSIGRIAREKLNMVSPTEIIYLIQTNESNMDSDIDVEISVDDE